MKKLLLTLCLMALLGVGSYAYLNSRTVKIMDAHHGQYTAQILVDHLPWSHSASINWWLKNQSSILKQYNIPSADADGPIFITIYAFGDGYKEAGKKDRRCFDEMQATKNCIDKNILMSVRRTRDGDTEFSFDDVAYLRNQDGKITRSSRDEY
ncbi:DUF943 family protein [Serratia rubidaea]|uniref:DUF943 family protein n=1 Tax=Serratia rubidaea TaxID=61652 RepID=A0ABS0MJJ4_SERRU|nr:DUF943 family protein [Serratia rubidaea]MBH1932521.1 DUF943 family protein [Serratia rubidaea]MDC6119144.1 DUF943 family protein [Serratia rubidaea]MEB7584972.1 DUF943 family protein [Serratia rubidaea]